ncbi:MAG: ABC transporter ATP-binding protein [Ruminococcus sp.]|nr:ABC transporter ATP-binding protein [Ruminococcus sp.]
MLKLCNVSAGYDKKQILHGINLEIPTGKITTIIGNNGCGKSTLLKSIVGFLPLLDGDILINGTSSNELSQSELAKQIAYLPQSKNVPDITVERLVLHGRFPYLHYPRRYRNKDYKLAQEAMEQMGIAHLAERPLAELSGGMRQKTYIAMALTQQAPLIVMDEPTTYLDIAQQLKFAKIVKQLSARGKTLILVLHDILMALKLSDQITVMKDGKIVRCGKPDEILESGIIEEIYGVKVQKVDTQNGLQYFLDLPQMR